MTEDRKTPSAEHLKGSVKEAIGKLTGDARTETEGRRQKRDEPGSKAPGPGSRGSGPR
ncbi:CsbD family protein [Methylobacterium sp. NMS12]|uniref:CsbD family protein n=1 Tax=Methylobacterium sp. NMS12 TaxID=3079766 RepID=UPI003F883021